MSYTPKDATPTDASKNTVESNGVFDELTLKAPLANPVFSGVVNSVAYQVSAPQIDVATSTTINLVAGQLYMIDGSGLSITLNSSGLLLGQFCYLCIKNGCPVNTITYTNPFNSAVPISMAASQEYYFIVMDRNPGIALFGGTV
jgi:hypothetical protein